MKSAIAGLAAFRGLPRGPLAAIAARAHAVSAARNQAVVRAGQLLPGVLAILRGSLKVVLPQGGRVLRLLGPGESFGEANVLLGAPSQVDVVALAESTVGLLPAEALLERIEGDAGFALGMARALAAQLLAAIAGLEEKLPRHGAQRLASYLESLAPARGGGACTVSLPASKTVIAALLGIEKETLSRLLHELSARQLIRVSGREIAILDRAGLARSMRQAAAPARGSPRRA
jgi:CRP-like cAMP-binding protein